MASVRLLEWDLRHLPRHDTGGTRLGKCKLFGTERIPDGNESIPMEYRSCPFEFRRIDDFDIKHCTLPGPVTQSSARTSCTIPSRWAVRPKETSLRIPLRSTRMVEGVPRRANFSNVSAEYSLAPRYSFTLRISSIL